MIRDPYRIVLKPRVTEKGTLLQEGDRKSYVFEVHPKANKQEIREAFETIYKDKKLCVVKVTTMRVKGKFRRVRIQAGYTQDIKKAIITLKPGQVLEMV